jgi:hypothetical protein
MGVISMKKILTFAVVAGGALALAACSGETAKAPEEPAATEAAAPVAEAPAAVEATAEEELDPTGNPIGMDKPANATDSMAAEAPAAE